MHEIYETFKRENFIPHLYSCWWRLVG